MLEQLLGLLVKEERFQSHINTLSIKWDKIPNPTVEERQTSKIPCLAHRTTARNLLGKLLLKYRYRKGGFGGPAVFTKDGTVLEVYPIPTDLDNPK